MCHLWLQSNHLYIYWTNLKRKKRKALLEDEVDHLKCAFSVHQVSECNMQNCQGTEIMNPLHLLWVLAHNKHFHTPDEPPWPKHQEKELPRLADKCSEGHSTFWACSSFSTQAKGNPSLALKLSQGLQIHQHSPSSLQTLHSHPQTARELCLSVCSSVTITCQSFY